MKIKFLSVIVSFLFVSIAISSCLNSDETYEISADATVHAFGIDTIHGKHYRFTIDQLNRLIYNSDSLPVGADTIIDSIMIDTFSVAGWITSGLNDTLFNMNNPANLIAAMNNDNGMKFKVHAPDEQSVKEYKLKVNVHLQDPDSLVWRNMTEANDEHGVIISNFPTTPLGNKHKVVTFKNDVWIYTFHSAAVKAYKISTANYSTYQCLEKEVKGLPASVDLKETTLLQFSEKLYIVAKDGSVYHSPDGEEWSKAESLSGNINTLITGFANTLAGIQTIDGVSYFCTTDAATMNWVRGEEVSADFPSYNLYSTVFHTDNGVEKAMLVGMPLTEEGEKLKTVPWFSMNGNGWASLYTSSDAFCPGVDHPTIIHYDDKFYIFGGKFDAMYSSLTGIAWQKVEKKFLLPNEIKYRGNYSMTVDKGNFIWLVLGGKDAQEPNQIWRGRLNKLGFKNQQ